MNININTTTDSIDYQASNTTAQKINDNSRYGFTQYHKNRWRVDCLLRRPGILSWWPRSKLHCSSLSHRAQCLWLPTNIRWHCSCDRTIRYMCNHPDRTRHPIQDMGIHGRNSSWLYRGDNWLHRSNYAQPTTMGTSRLHHPDL